MSSDDTVTFVTNFSSVAQTNLLRSYEPVTTQLAVAVSVSRQLPAASAPAQRGLGPLR